MRYPEDDAYQQHEVRSGWLWEWQVRLSAKLAPEMSFPGLEQVIEVHRRRTSKATGEIKEHTAYFLTSLALEAQGAYWLVRKRWSSENRLHHKRDTIFAEDKCRTRKGAQAFAALRNVLIGLLHQLDKPGFGWFAVSVLPLIPYLSCSWKIHDKSLGGAVQALQLDLLEVPWSRLEGSLPPMQRVGRPHEHDRQLVLRAILHVMRTDCGWRNLPSRFPAWQTVYAQFSRWKKTGIWDKLWSGLKQP